MKQKQLLIFFVTVGLLSFIFSPSVSAQTATTTVSSLEALIQQLQEQIKTLQAKIDTLRQSQLEVKEARQEVAETVKLIRQLDEGMTGNDVKLLQAALAADPEIYPEGLTTGYYGRLTAQAVKRFQKRMGLEQVGRVGPKTLQKMNENLDSNPLSLEDSAEGKRPCAIVPPGHLIAPGWLRKHDGVRPIVPQCQDLPYGIQKKLDTTATTTPPTPDIVPPIISSISVSNIASTTATVSWNTNESATSKAYYGTSSPLNLDLAYSTTNNALITNHSLNLSALTASTTYYFVVESKDASNNTATSSQQNFTTLP